MKIEKPMKWRPQETLAVSLIVAATVAFGPPAAAEAEGAAAAEVRIEQPQPGGRVGTLDDELDRALGVFDSQVGDIRSGVQKDPGPPSSEPTASVDIKRPGSGAGDVSGWGSGSDPSVAADGTGQEGSSGDSDEEPSSSSQPEDFPTAGDEQSGNMPTDGGARMPSAPIPDDIPDGQDDDIVARQLRELAMAEKDPALREKYWEEYRRYKKGTGK